MVSRCTWQLQIFHFWDESLNPGEPLGLGLYISRAIIDAHSGRIWAAANTEARSGSVFGFRIPRVAMPLASSGIAPTGEAPAFVLRRRGE